MRLARRTSAAVYAELLDIATSMRSTVFAGARPCSRRTMPSRARSTVLATSRSDAKLARLREMGASDVINYTASPDWDARVLELTDGLGVDHVVEVGGANTLAKSLNAVKMGARISLIGILSGAGQVNPMPVLFKSVCLKGIYVGSREMFEEMNRAMAANNVRPVIDRIFPFENTREAYRYLESGAHFGKVCISL